MSTALTTVEVVRSIAESIGGSSRADHILDEQITTIQKKLQAKSVNRLRTYRLVAAVASALLTGAIFLGKDVPKQIFSYEERIRRAQRNLETIKTELASYEQRLVNLSKQRDIAMQALKARETPSRDRKATSISSNEATYAALSERLGKEARAAASSLLDNLEGAIGPDNPILRSAVEQRLDEGMSIEDLQRLGVQQGKRVTDWQERSVEYLRQAQADATSQWQIGSFSLACVCGALSGLLTLSIRRAELTLEELKETLASKTMAHRVIREAFNSVVPKEWTVMDMAGAIELWVKRKNCPYAHLASVVGSLSLAQYILGCSRQAGLIQIKEELRGDEYLELHSIRAPTTGIT